MTNRENQFFCNECQTYQPIDPARGETEGSQRRSHKGTTCEEAKLGKILPAGLHNWFMANRLHGTNLIYSSPADSQVMWVRDTLHQVFTELPSNPFHELERRYKQLEAEARAVREETKCSYDEAGYPDYRDGPGDFVRNGVRVVSVHTSKSCKLPVYGIDYIPGLVLTLRGNFHNWQISVKSERDLDLDLFGVGESEERGISHCYCEGFPGCRWSPNTYPDNKKDFTVTVWGPRERVYTLLWQIGKNFR
jgi:hypothetical protein